MVRHVEATVLGIPCSRGQHPKHPKIRGTPQTRSHHVSVGPSSHRGTVASTRAEKSSPVRVKRKRKRKERTRCQEHVLKGEFGAVRVRITGAAVFHGVSHGCTRNNNNRPGGANYPRSAQEEEHKISDRLSD